MQAIGGCCTSSEVQSFLRADASAERQAGTVPGTGVEVGATQKPGPVVSGGAEARSSAAVQAALTALMANQ
jgi:hypothetical protein